jgi:hypothetical protein
MPFPRIKVSDVEIDKMGSDLYRIVNLLEKRLNQIQTGENQGPSFNLPFGWKLVCSPSNFKVTQYDIDKGLEL